MATSFVAIATQLPAQVVLFSKQIGVITTKSDLKISEIIKINLKIAIFLIKTAYFY